MFRRVAAAWTRFARTPATAVAAAACMLGVSAWLLVWGAERAFTDSGRASRRDHVRSALVDARALLARRQNAAEVTATRLASSTVVQNAFARHDRAALARIARTRPNVSFVLWNGRTVGRPPVPGLGWTVGVFGTSGLVGRVAVGTEPDATLLERARRDVRLAYTVAGRIRAAAPQAALAGIPTHAIAETVDLNDDATRAARLTAWASPPHIPLRRVWPWLAALVAAAVGYRVFDRREARRRAEAPPKAVRDAVALVGETLAATHNPAALLPVILQAATEATDAVGGTIVGGGQTIASRGTVPTDAWGSIEVELEVEEGRPATMTLYPPPGGFGEGARDTADWIAGQALIALENARLHGLVQRQAVTDELTGLPNRRRFLSQLEAETLRSRRTGSPLAVVLADLDDFKNVNDTWGHHVGDDALRTFAGILRETVRDVDLPVRLGGEEFAILLPDTDLDGGARLAERVRAALEAATLTADGTQFRLTASFGVSCYPVAASAEDVLTDADRRLYDAKRQGKNRVVSSAAPRSANLG